MYWRPVSPAITLSVMTIRAARLAHSWLLTLVVALLVAPPAHANPDAEQPWLGVGINASRQGVQVLEVIPDTPAEEAGLLPGDLIVAIAGFPVKTPNQLRTVVGRYVIGDRISVRLARGGDAIERVVFLGPRLDPDEILYRRLVGKRAPDFDLDVVYGPDSGDSEDLSRQVLILQFFTKGCNDCLDQHETLSRLAAQHRGGDLSIIAVTLSDRAGLSRWAHAHTPSFSVARDPTARTFRRYRVESMVPVLVVIDRSFRVRYAGIGGADNLERALQSARRALRRSSALR